MPDIAETSTTSLEDDLREIDALIESDKGEKPSPTSKKVEPPAEEEESEEEDKQLLEEEEEEEEEEEIKEVPEEEFKAPAEDEQAVNFPRIEELKKVYPDILKKFPELRSAIFQTHEYHKLFPTVADAKEANENNNAFMTLRQDIMEGDGTQFLEALKEVDTKNLTRFAGVFLPALYKISPQDHWEALLPPLENLVKTMYRMGKEQNNENLTNSAEWVAKFLFNDHKIASSDNRAPRNKIIQQELDKPKPAEGDKRDPIETRFREDTFVDGQKRLAGIIEKAFEINTQNENDPINGLSEFFRNVLAEKAYMQIHKILEEDPEYMSFMQSLWSRAKRNGWSRDDSAKIISTFLARAKNLLPSVRSKLVSEATKTAKDISSRKLKVASQNNRSQVPGGRPASGNRNSGPVNPKTIDWSKTSDEDILNDNIKTR